MCGVLPCEFWRFVVVNPGESLALAFACGFLAGLWVVVMVQAASARIQALRNG